MKLAEQLYAFIAPHDCIACGSEGSLLCNWCVEDVLREHDSRCYRCNSLTQAFAVCATCRRASALRHVFIRSEYTDASKELVQQMKFSYSREAAAIIAAELVSILPVLAANTLVVHVPAVNSHLRERGFDHAKLIASAVSAHTGYEHLPALARTNNRRQVGASRKQRLAQQTNAFRLKEYADIKGRAILLIDDVITTGATLESAAKILRSAGAKSVSAAVFARTPL